MKAKILAWSVNPAGDQLITAEMKYPRWLHPEIMTYGMLAKSSASSRAIPVEKILKQVEEQPEFPMFYGYEQRGMQSGEEMSSVDLWDAECMIEQIHEATVNIVKEYIESHAKEHRLHKSLINRYLEPFMEHTVILTANATAWNHVMSQRIHPDAEKHIDYLMRLFQVQLEENKPKELQWGEWHLPFADNLGNDVSIADKVKVSSARCARSSYLNHNGVISVEDDLSLYGKLFSADPPHLSPFEHPAMAEENWAKVYADQGKFKGFRQHRYEVENGLKIGAK